MHRRNGKEQIKQIKAIVNTENAAFDTTLNEYNKQMSYCIRSIQVVLEETLYELNYETLSTITAKGRQH